MPSSDAHPEHPDLTSDELLGGMAYYAATSTPDTDLDRELAQLLAAEQRRRAGDIPPCDPRPGR
jgi:hypothetical protein